jgi:hypothetical protein
MSTVTPALTLLSMAIEPAVKWHPSAAKAREPLKTPPTATVVASEAWRALRPRSPDPGLRPPFAARRRNRQKSAQGHHPQALGTASPDALIQSLMQVVFPNPAGADTSAICRPDSNLHSVVVGEVGIGLVWKREGHGLFSLSGQDRPGG